MGPIPDGVPVAITSPGRSVITCEIKDTSRYTGKIKSAVDVSCRSCPLSRVSMLAAAGSSSVSMQGPIGQNVSNPLAAGKLAVFFLQIPGGHVIEAGIAENIIRGILLGNIFAKPSYHHAKLAFIVHPLRHLWIYDGSPGADNCRGRLQKQQGLIGDGHFHFLRMAAVIEPHGNNLARHAGRQQFDLPQPEALFPDSIIRKNIPCYFLHLQCR